MRRRLPTLTVLACLAALALPAAASAAEPYDPDASPENTGFNPPTPTAAPTISGGAGVGGTLTGSRGTWPAGTQLSSRWLRCNVGTSSCDSTGDTDLSYQVTAADIGFVIKLRVIAVQPGFFGIGSGTRVADSAPTTTILAPATPAAPTPPFNVRPPSIEGTVQVGQRLTAQPGQWTGTQPLRFSYGWFSCTARSTRCVSRSTSQTYTPAVADVGRRLVVSVLAFNRVGQASKAVTSPIVPSPAAVLRKLGPFPRLLLDGRVAGRTTTIRTFRFNRVARGALVTITCRGRGCPFRSTKVRAGKSSTVRVKRLQRRLRSGLTVVATVRKGNTLGKYTRLRFRRALAPARVDRCVAPGSEKPLACPR